MARRNLADNIDKLLEIAESSDTPVKFEKKSDVEDFINEIGIKDGETRVPTYIIYYKYYLWKKNKRNLRASRSFFYKFKSHFTGTATIDGRGYLLDPEPFDMSQTGYFKARALLRRQREKNGRKKENQKKQS